MTIYNLNTIIADNDYDAIEIIKNNINVFKSDDGLYHDIEEMLNFSKHEIFKLLSVNLEKQLLKYMRISKENNEIYVFDNTRLTPLHSLNTKKFLTDLISYKFKQYNIKAEMYKFIKYLMTESPLVVPFKQNYILINNEYYIDMNSDVDVTEKEYLPKLQLTYDEKTEVKEVNEFLNLFNDSDRLLSLLANIFITNNYIRRCDGDKVLNLIDENENSIVIDSLIKMLKIILQDNLKHQSFSVLTNKDLAELQDVLVVVSTDVEKESYSNVVLMKLKKLYDVNNWKKSPNCLIDVNKGVFANNKQYDPQIFANISVKAKLDKNKVNQLMDKIFLPNSINYFTRLLINRSKEIKSTSL